MTACLGDETIAAMFEGGLSPDAAQRARDHLASCDACRRLVSAAVDHVDEETASIPETVREGVAPGAVLDGKYRIERALGEGGMGRVYVARQLGLERAVAIKVLRPDLLRDANAVKRFRREARLVAQLASDRVVRVHDLGEVPGGTPYLVMELLEGEDLASVIERGPVPYEQAIAWILATCEALAEAHALGIVHRDVKPSNLFVTKDGRLKVLDFGLAKLWAPMTTATNVTATGQILGSPRYMAPEQVLGAREVDARADIWSVGATLYHLVTGAPPFPEMEIDRVLSRILDGRLPPLERVRRDVAAVIARCLARDPGARYASVRDVAAALAGAPAVAAPLPHATTAAPPPPAARGPQASTVIGIVVAVLAGLLLVGGGIAASAWLGWRKLQSAGPISTPTLPTLPTLPTSPKAAPPSGRLALLDEARIRARLAAHGWQVGWSKQWSTGTCDMLQMGIGTPSIGLGWSLAFEDCPSASVAESEKIRLGSGDAKGWVIQDAARVLYIGLGDEKTSRQVAEQVADGP